MNKKEVKKAPALRFKGFTNDWEQRKLSDETNRIRSYSISHGFEVAEDTGTKYIHYGDIHTGKVKNINNINVLPNIEDNNYKPLKYGDVIVADASEDYKGIADACIVNTISNSYKIVAGLHTIAFRPKSKLCSKFLYFYLSTDIFKHFGYKTGTGLKVFGISYKELAKFKLKEPSATEQKKIVKLLFLIEKAIHLHQRKLESFQFTYHEIIRRLFLKKAKWQQTKLSDLVTILDKNRKPVKKEDRLLGDTPYYGANGIQDYISGFTHKGEFILIAEDGANSLTEYPIYFVKGQIWVNNHAHVLKVNRDVSPLFLALALKQINYSKYTVGSSRNKLNLKDLENITIFIPDNNEQQKIGQFYSNYLNYLRINKKRIQYMKQFKQFLLQNMFI